MLYCLCRTIWHCPVVKTHETEKTGISMEQWPYLLYVITPTSYPPPPFLFQKWPNAYFIFVHLYDKFNFIVRLLFRIITCPIHFNFTATLLSRVNYNEIFVCSAEFYRNNAVERCPSIVVFEGRCWHANTALLFPWI